MSRSNVSNSSTIVRHCFSKVRFLTFIRTDERNIASVFLIRDRVLPLKLIRTDSSSYRNRARIDFFFGLVAVTAPGSHRRAAAMNSVLAFHLLATFLFSPPSYIPVGNTEIPNAERDRSVKDWDAVNTIYLQTVFGSRVSAVINECKPVSPPVPTDPTFSVSGLKWATRSPGNR